MITYTSGWPWPVTAIQDSGAISAPARLRPRARSAPRDRQARTATVASPYPHAAIRPHMRCRWSDETSVTPKPNRPQTANAAATQLRCRVTSDDQDSSGLARQTPPRTGLPVSKDIQDPPRARSYPLLRSIPASVEATVRPGPRSGRVQAVGVGLRLGPAGRAAPADRAAP